MATFQSTIKETVNGVNFYSAPHDVNGNPRRVVHFPDFLKPEEFDALGVLKAHELAGMRAKACGFSELRASWFGGGFICSTYSVQTRAKMIEEEREAFPFSGSCVRNKLYSAIYSDIMEKADNYEGKIRGLVSELARYRKEFRRVPGYNYVQYGNLEVYYYNIRQQLTGYGYKAANWSDDRVWRFYIEAVGEVIDKILYLYEK